MRMLLSLFWALVGALFVDSQSFADFISQRSSARQKSQDAVFLPNHFREKAYHTVEKKWAGVLASSPGSR